MITTGSVDSADLVAEDVAELKEIASGATLEQVLTAVRIFGQLDLGFDNYPTLPLELALVDCILAGESEPEKAATEAKTVNTPPPVKEAEPRTEPPVAETKPEPEPVPDETGEIGTVDEIPEPIVSEKTEDETEAEAEPVAEVDETEAEVEPTAEADETEGKAEPSAEVEETVTVDDTESLPEPEPVETAASAAPTGNGSEIESLKQNWKQVIADAPPDTKKSSAIAILRSGVTPVALENDTVALSFRYPLLKEQIEKLENQKVVEKILSNYLGRPCRVTCVLEEDNQLLKAALKMGAQIIDQEEK